MAQGDRRMLEPRHDERRHDHDRGLSADPRPGRSHAGRGRRDRERRATDSLLGGGGVDGAIHRRGGPEILTECKRIRATQYPDGLPTGEAVITTAGRLLARHVIHTVGPVYSRKPEVPALLAACHTNSLALARREGIRTVAFPAISTGVYGYPVELAAEVALGAVVARSRGQPGALGRGPVRALRRGDARGLHAYARRTPSGPAALALVSTVLVLGLAAPASAISGNSGGAGIAIALMVVIAGSVPWALVAAGLAGARGLARRPTLGAISGVAIIGFGVMTAMLLAIALHDGHGRP